MLWNNMEEGIRSDSMIALSLMLIIQQLTLIALWTFARSNLALGSLRMTSLGPTLLVNQTTKSTSK